jgi:hypothetical protein
MEWITAEWNGVSVLMVLGLVAGLVGTVGSVRAFWNHVADLNAKDADRKARSCAHGIGRSSGIVCKICAGQFKAEAEAEKKKSAPPPLAAPRAFLVPSMPKWRSDEEAMYPDLPKEEMTFTVPVRPGQLVVVVEHFDYGRVVKEAKLGLSVVYRAKVRALVHYVTGRTGSYPAPKEFEDYVEIDEMVANMCSKGDRSVAPFRLREMRFRFEELGRNLLEELSRPR